MKWETIRHHPLVLNWRTSTAGASMIFTGLGDILHQISLGNPSGDRLMADATAIAGGVGLLMARDAK